ncbi:diacylglycerol/lipid kinase family protein [Nesterenkonia sp. HG001]|uniref:diacylglycerol/lipid kinase family protein n=1 Tax=Nesterenkonia sp. HG001 TaxID=2983207 RepID=UPI002AC79DE9|nr:diacylglycerol kinase family protein [Nesterenkonia sp. HG001]MDZ5078255.1 diacylglycerol kinase family protein [Nesterenkonia sp. HG001]
MSLELLFTLLIASALVHVIALVVIIRALVTTRRLQEEIAEIGRLQDRAQHDADHGLPTRAERQVALVVNPTKAEADEVVRLVHSACSRAGMQAPLLLATTASDPGHQMAADAVSRGAHVVIAAGGDGTVRAVAAELTGTDVALGIIPMGTGNLFARNIGLPYQDLQACVDESLHGLSHRVDTLDLALHRADGTTDKENSLVIAGGGLDAEVMGDTREALKQRAGWLAYGESGMRHVMGRRRSITVAVDDAEPETHRVRSVLLANCGMLQAGMILVPSARFDDGRLDAVLFTPRHAWDWAKIVAKTVTRFTADIPVMTVRQARVSTLTMAEPLPFQIDGDAVGEVVAVEARVRPSSLIVNGVTGAPWMESGRFEVDPAEDWERRSELHEADGPNS